MIMNKFFIIQLVLFSVLFIIIIFLLRNIIANRKASRIKYYSLKSIKNTNIAYVKPLNWHIFLVLIIKL